MMLIYNTQTVNNQLINFIFYSKDVFDEDKRQMMILKELYFIFILLMNGDNI